MNAKLVSFLVLSFGAISTLAQNDDEQVMEILAWKAYDGVDPEDLRLALKGLYDFVPSIAGYVVNQWIKQ